jgi:N-acetyl-beta-hexosaminidase
MIAQLELEVQQLLARAEQADATPLQDGLTISDEITRRQERKVALAQARAEIEARAQARYTAQLTEHQQKLTGRAAKKQCGEKVCGLSGQPLLG